MIFIVEGMSLYMHNTQSYAKEEFSDLSANLKYLLFL